jgi:CHASE2 domain-containing sensor protein
MRWKIWPSSQRKKIELEKQGISLLERAFKAAPAIIVGVLLTFFLSRSHYFRQLETQALDTQVRMQGAPEDSDVAVVLINDADYAGLFQSKSPLDQATLLKLINAIAAGQPRVIGIDIDTSAPEFREAQASAAGPRVVWARNGVFSNVDGKYHLFEFIGGKQTETQFGLVVMRLDADDIIRRYTRLCDSEQGQVASFPWAVAKAFAPQVTASQEPTTEDLFIKFAGDRAGSHRLHFSAARILELADGPGWQADSPIKDKIVLLGGGYRAEDEHDTPLGWMLGVEVLAYAVETELHGGGVAPPSQLLVMALGGLGGLALLLLFQHFKPSKAFLLSLLSIPVLGMLASLVTFRSIAFWIYFVPIPLAVLAQETYSEVKDYRKKLIKGLYEGVVGKPAEAVEATTQLKENLIAVDEAVSAPAESSPKIQTPDLVTKGDEGSQTAPEEIHSVKKVPGPKG